MLVNTLRITGVQVIAGGDQVVCLPGATLDKLEQTLAPLGREPHSVIGSSCIGASVLGGICNNSGGALVRRGPAYTELALYARVKDDGTLELVNHLGIALGDTPEEILTRLQNGDYAEADVQRDTGRAASDARYAQDVRAVDADTPPASMPTRPACSRPRAPQARCACLPCGWTPSPRNPARCSTSAATRPMTSPPCVATCSPPCPAHPLPVNTSTARRLTLARSTARTPSCSSTTLARPACLRPSHSEPVGWVL